MGKAVELGLFLPSFPPVPLDLGETTAALLTVRGKDNIRDNHVFCNCFQELPHKRNRNW